MRFLHVPGVVNLTGPRGNGQLTVAAAGRLFLLGTSGQPVPFARGSGGYTTAVGPEPYIAMPTGKLAAGLGCSFGNDATYALQPNGSPGVIRIDKQGQARRFANLPGVRPDGIAFDDVGRFGYRLLVTATARGGTTVFGIDCAGRVTTIASHAPRVEGGIAVAPLSFGSFGGDLVAPDETTGRVWAIGPGGKTRLIARSPLPAGGDIGVESAAFVPAGFSRDWAAYVADRRSPGNRHPGTNSILRLPGAELTRAGIHAGELIVASEGGAQTIVDQLLRDDLHGPAHRGRAGGGPRRGPHRLRPAPLTQADRPRRAACGAGPHRMPGGSGGFDPGQAERAGAEAMPSAEPRPARRPGPPRRRCPALGPGR